MSLSRATLITFLTRSGSAVARFLSLVVFIRLLSPSVYGQFVLFETVAVMAGLAADLGLNGAIEKRVSETDSGRTITTGLLLKGLLAGLVGVFVVLGHSSINAYLSAPLAGYLVVGLILQQLGRAFIAILRGELQLQSAALIEFGNRAVFLVAGLGFILAGFELLALIYAYFVGWGFVITIATIQTDSMIGRPSWETVRSLVAFSKYNAVTSLLGSSYDWMDTIIIGMFLPPAFVAAYQAAWRIAGFVMLLSQAVATTLFPSVSQWATENQTDRIEAAIPPALGFSLLFVIPALPGGYLFGDDILRLVFSPEVAIAAPALAILLVGKIPEAVNSVVGRTLLGLNRPRATAISATVFVGVNLGLNVLLVPRFGLVGAALATTSAFAVNTGLNTLLLSQQLTIRVPRGILVWCCGAAVVMAAVLVGLTQIVKVESVLELAAVIGTGAVVYLALVTSKRQIRMQLVTFASPS